MYPNAHQHYQESQVMTASKGKLLLMTYDGAIRFIRQARLHMETKSYENQNTCIIKGQRLLLELISTLDEKADARLAADLLRLYEYLFNRLVEANLSDSLGALDEVLGHLTDLRATWAEADRRASGGPLHAFAAASTENRLALAA